MADNIYSWKDVEDQLVPAFSSTISLMDKILHSAAANYIASKKLYLFRELCFGFLCTGRNNSDATLKLLEANLVDQIHYISRNTFEMMVILYYIDNDRHTKDVLSQRFFDYSTVDANQAMNVMINYPETFRGMRTEEDDRKAKQNYETFISRYTCSKPDLRTWSGKDMYHMIDSLKDVDIKADFLKRYRFMVWSNNKFLHPTPLSLQQSIIRYLNGEIDHKYRVMQLSSVFTSMFDIIKKVLGQFNKGRIELRNELDKIKDQHEEITRDARYRGLLDEK
jgi:hypothetical protein